MGGGKGMTINVGYRQHLDRRAGKEGGLDAGEAGDGNGFFF